MCFKFLESRSQLINSIGSFHQSHQDSIFHMIYLTVAHCVRHGSPTSSSDLSTVYAIVSGIMLDGHLQHFEAEDLNGIKSLDLKQQAHGHFRLSRFMDEVQITRSFTPLLGSSGSPSAFCQITFSTMNQYQFQIDS